MENNILLALFLKIFECVVSFFKRLIVSNDSRKTTYIDKSIKGNVIIINPVIIYGDTQKLVRKPHGGRK